MNSVFYFTVTVLGLSAMWLVWDLGLKKLFLDGFRERLFELRFNLFAIAASGEISFDDEAYRAIETLLCGMIRFAHRMTFMGYLFSSMQQKKDKEADEFINFHQQLKLKISRAPIPVQRKLSAVMAAVSKLVIFYIGLNSLLFMATLPIILLLRSFNLLRDFTKLRVSSVLETEAYKAESRQTKIVTPVHV